MSNPTARGTTALCNRRFDITRLLLEATADWSSSPDSYLTEKTADVPRVVFFCIGCRRLARLRRCIFWWTPWPTSAETAKPRRPCTWQAESCVRCRGHPRLDIRRLSVYCCHRADVNGADADSWTPLCETAGCDDLVCTRHRSADPSFANGTTPLQVARKLSNSAVAKLSADTEASGVTLMPAGRQYRFY